MFAYSVKKYFLFIFRFGNRKVSRHENKSCSNHNNIHDCGNGKSLFLKSTQTSVKSSTHQYHYDESALKKPAIPTECLIDRTSSRDMTESLIYHQNKIDIEDDTREKTDPADVNTVRLSLENVSVPSWYKKYSQKQDNDERSRKWKRDRDPSIGWRRQRSVDSLIMSRSPSPSALSPPRRSPNNISIKEERQSRFRSVDISQNLRYRKC